MATIIVKALLLTPVFFLGLVAGAFAGHVNHGLRYGAVKRRTMDGPTLRPFAVIGAVLAILGVTIYWQVTGR